VSLCAPAVRTKVFPLIFRLSISDATMPKAVAAEEEGAFACDPCTKNRRDACAALTDPPLHCARLPIVATNFEPGAR